jgi:GNAT superfamily N-acetyltransferase
MPKFTPVISTNKESVRPKELMQLWASVDWCEENDYAPQTVRAAIRNTTLLISARNQYGELIGMARVMSDGVFSTWLAELIVHPDYQSLGVGKRLVKAVRDYYDDTSIVLETFQWNRKFFKKCGFKESKMTVFYNS